MSPDAEKEFNKIVAQESDDSSEISNVTKMLQELKASMAELAPIIQQAAEAKEKIDKDMDVHKQALSKLTLAKNEVELQVYDVRKKMKSAEHEISLMEKRLIQAMENKNAREEFLRLSEEFDRMTMGAPWREFAFDHQITGAKRLATQHRAILADKRGLGKTLTSIAMLDMTGAKKVLAIVPNDTVGNFEREVKHWAPHRTPIKLAGVPKIQRDFVLSTLPDISEFILILNYEAWRRDKEYITQLLAIQFDTLILDESHNIKDRKTIAFKGIKELTQANNCCSQCGSNNVFVDF